MSWTYSGDPSKTPLDKYRFAVGDTNQNAPIMSDAEITYLIATYGSNENVLLYQLFTQAATFFSTKPTKRKLGPQSEDTESRLEYYTKQAALYRAKVASAGISLPRACGPGVFSIGMHNNPPVRGDQDV